MKGLENKRGDPRGGRPNASHSLVWSAGVLCSCITAASAGPTEREKSEKEMQDTRPALPVVPLANLWTFRWKSLCKS